jgi:hypothetical protein
MPELENFSIKSARFKLPGSAILLNGVLQPANRENGAPGFFPVDLLLKGIPRTSPGSRIAAGLLIACESRVRHAALG